jgi:tRNA modification GTPase
MDPVFFRERAGGLPVVEVSCVSEEGIQKLEDEVFRFVSGGRLEIPEETVIQSVRQRELLEKTLACVEEAREACAGNLSPEFIASDVRMALGHLGALVGEVVTDEVLDALFSQFCIGK